MTAVVRPPGPVEVHSRQKGLESTGLKSKFRDRSAVGTMGILCIFGFFATLLAMASLHSVLVNGQFEFDRLQDRLELGQERSQVLREEVARLESPSRILNAATGRLGMTPPPNRLYLPSVVPGDPLRPLPFPPENPFSLQVR
ncbi:MAG TPA: hypothetical protein DF783_04810 [Acidimicrobiaceae bacterium]|nr:hypothetical protein [Acidimicrobiaceae bacterium]MDP7258069.1 hypothetical protein [Acidimicrobiales bacterium]HCV36228.1 hypothetical protein [Acidimicrobiaceae bacterium]HJO80522.1 hypothetical protein [Acidimicrobiales bacterium]